MVPTGALIGLDAVTAAAEKEIQSVRMVTRKPVSGLAGAPYLVENNIDIADIVEPLKIFEARRVTPQRAFLPISTLSLRSHWSPWVRTGPRCRSGPTRR